jgi:hypothetical protein
LPKFFSLKIYIKHCRFVEVLLSSRSTTNTVDLSKLFSLQDPQQTLHIRRFFRTGAGTSSTESGNIAATQDGCNEIPRACMHRIDQFVSPPSHPQIFVLISGGVWAKSRSISCCTACLITELHWIHLRCRYVVAVNGIICVYSFLESWLAVWTFVRGSLVLPEAFQVWFDFGHDQVMHEVCTWNGFNMEQSFPRSFFLLKFLIFLPGDYLAECSNFVLQP